MTDIILNTEGLDKILREMPAMVEDFLDAEAEAVVTDVKLSFGTSAPGRVYERGLNRVHVASVEGSPPNVDTGALRASMRWYRDGAFTRIVADGVNYGIHLEEGTEGMGARPFMSPAFAEAGRGFAGRFREAFGRWL